MGCDPLSDLRFHAWEDPCSRRYWRSEFLASEARCRSRPSVPCKSKATFCFVTTSYSRQSCPQSEQFALFGSICSANFSPHASRNSSRSVTSLPLTGQRLMLSQLRTGRPTALPLRKSASRACRYASSYSSRFSDQNIAIQAQHSMAQRVKCRQAQGL